MFTIFTYKLCYYPEAGGDENAYLAFVFRIFNYGLRDWPLYFSDTFNKGPHLISPFPNSLLPTIMLHKILGVSQYAGRIITTTFLLLPCFVLCFSVYFHKRQFKPYLFSLIVIGLLPSVLITARSIRPEAEVICLGFFSQLILFTSLFNLSKKTYPLLWFFSGMLAFLAVCDHPLGVIFGASIFISIFLFSNALYKIDNLTTLTRAAYWFLGMLIPLFNFLYRLENYGFGKFYDYMHYCKIEFYQPLNEYMINYFITAHPFINILTFIPNRIRADLIQITYYSFLPEYATLNVFTGVKALYSFLIWALIVLTLIYFKCLFIFKNNKKYILTNFLCVQFILSIAVIFFFNPNTAYHIYPAFCGALFLISICYLNDEIRKLNILYFFSRALLVLFVISNLSYVFVFLKNMYMLDHRQSLTIDKRIPIFTYINNTLTPYHGRAYVEPNMWRIGNQNLGALSEIFLNHKLIESPATIAFNEKSFDYFFYYYSQITNEKPTTDVLFSRIKPYLNNLKLNFIVLNKNKDNEVYRVYGKSKKLEIIIYENNMVTVYQLHKIKNLCNLSLNNTKSNETLIAFMKDFKSPLPELATTNNSKYKTNSEWLENIIITKVGDLKNDINIENHCNDYKSFFLYPQKNALSNRPID